MKNYRHAYINNGISVWIYSYGTLEETIPIDPTYNALNWCVRRGLTHSETITTIENKTFLIFRSKDFHLAIPA